MSLSPFYLGPMFSGRPITKTEPLLNNQERTRNYRTIPEEANDAEANTFNTRRRRRRRSHLLPESANFCSCLSNFVFNVGVCLCWIAVLTMCFFMASMALCILGYLIFLLCGFIYYSFVIINGLFLNYIYSAGTAIRLVDGNYIEAVSNEKAQAWDRIFAPNITGRMSLEEVWVQWLHLGDYNVTSGLKVDTAETEDNAEDVQINGDYGTSELKVDTAEVDTADKAGEVEIKEDYNGTSVLKAGMAEPEDIKSDFNGTSELKVDEAELEDNDETVEDIQINRREAVIENSENSKYGDPNNWRCGWCKTGRWKRASTAFAVAFGIPNRPKVESKRKATAFAVAHGIARKPVVYSKREASITEGLPSGPILKLIQKLRGKYPRHYGLGF